MPVRQWLADATYINEHSDIEQATNMMVDAWFEYWIEIKRKTVRPNTVRNYTERYHRNIQKVIDKKLLTEVAGINKFSMHVLRHTLATRCIEGGMMPKTLQKILGHSNIGITMNLYVHITEEEKQKEISMVACVLNVV